MPRFFARNLHEMGLMSARDFQNYRELFAIMTSYLRAPDLLVYLRASVPTLVRHIQSRGREFESTIRIEYLERLNRHYERWIEQYDLGPKLLVDVDELDFVNEEEHRTEVVRPGGEPSSLGSSRVAGSPWPLPRSGGHSSFSSSF
jgi:deoxyadenosine/deoxycytidine kinase